jgi:hypothetical protein
LVFGSPFYGVLLEAIGVVLVESAVLLQFDQRVAGQPPILVQRLGLDRVVGPGDPGHRRTAVCRRVLAFDVAVDLPAVLLEGQSGVVVDLCGDELAAGVLPGLSAKLLQAGQFQRLLRSDSARGIELQHADDQVLDVFVAIPDVAVEAPPLHSDLAQHSLRVGAFQRLQSVNTGRARKLNDLLQLVQCRVPFVKGKVPGNMGYPRTSSPRMQPRLHMSVALP